jgi:hypothetical protein
MLLFLCISEWCSVDSLGHFIFSCVSELLPFKQAEIWPVWRSIVIKQPSLDWKLTGMWFLDSENIHQMSDFNTGRCHNEVGCLLSSKPLIIFLQYSYLEKCVIYDRGSNIFLLFVCLFSLGCIAWCRCDCQTPPWDTSICRLKMVRL